ncbi:nitroreductase family deazaflavin-dependent oxidoreductase [Catenulispora sp. NF23]|uniref:Nitroreductase family deazaflavin-dependent oxidoreductase n=1 Tax=Catenulispora pinistramenti TaxID=2705254 RepID=A0ABS5KQU6_9ACTN|nr:nitroreductase family deazaflavin-dependent oxidoreductase [Catenulispora pinistramenti]MBS2533819.1 nitroreductase family deazaflavin-dependent oxidoreductase [Catenulispora pinistramenti]MBS2548426.1 nitroreductase family deazaflavin-dependent oxidoreductase [Catenulispora pinistramenti]
MSGVGTRLSARALRTRWFVRAPIGLYRAGLGFVFGSRLLMLEHAGRSTGARRFVVLEVVDHPAPGQYVVISGFGIGAQWYQNIQADPRVKVSIGLRRSMPATATPMTDAESATVLAHYIEHHPKEWEKLHATIEYAVGRSVDTLPMVSLRTA